MCCSAAPIKRTAVERQVNIQIVFLFMLLLALSIGSTVGSSIRSVCDLSFDLRGVSDIHVVVFCPETMVLAGNHLIIGSGYVVIPFMKTLSDHSALIDSKGVH